MILDYYDYTDIKSAALAKDAGSRERLALFDWCMMFAKNSYNGQQVFIDELVLTPIVEFADDEDICFIVDVDIFVGC